MATISFGPGTGILGNGIVTSFTPIVLPNKSVLFDGSSKIIGPTNQSVFDNTSANSWTIECWFNASAYPATGYSGIVEYHTTNIVAGWSIMLLPTGNKYITFQQWNSGASLSINTPVNSISLNTWYHLAVAYNTSTGLVSMYLDGVSQGTPTGIDLGTSSTRTFNIGAYGGVGNFNGYISNVRFVYGKAVYTGTFTPPTAALTTIQSAGTNIASLAGTETKMLACNSDTIIDASASAWTLTTGGSPSVQTAVGPF